jgi:hypothetical protein
MGDRKLPDDRTEWWTEEEWIQIESSYLMNEGESIGNAHKIAENNYKNFGQDTWPGELAYIQGINRVNPSLAKLLLFKDNKSQ